MEPEHLDFCSIMDERRKRAEETLAPLSLDGLRALETVLFPGVDHPWQERFQTFVAENGQNRFFTGEADDNVHFVYCPESHKGFWYRTGATRGLGPIQERGLNGLREITAGR